MLQHVADAGLMTIFPIKRDAAAARGEQAGDQGQNRRFAAAAGTDNRQKFFAVKAEGNPIQGGRFAV